MLTLRHTPAPNKRDILSGTDDVPRHEQCWAKTKNDRAPGISVRNHCLNVGWVAEALLALLPARLRERIPNCAPALAALHDVGKVSPGFQVKCQSWLVQNGLLDRAVREGWPTRESDHAKISQFTLNAEGIASRRGTNWHPYAVDRIIRRAS